MKISSDNINNQKLTRQSIKNYLRYSNGLSIKRILFDNSADIVSRYFRHLIAGGIGVLIYSGLIAFLVEIIKFNPVGAAIFSTILVSIYTYLIQRTWVYTTTSSHSKAIPRFITVGIIAILLNSGVMFLVVEVFQWWYGLGIICAAIIVPPTNFLFHYYWTYK